MALAGVAAAVYTITTGATGPRIAGGSIPPAAAAACAGPVTPVGHTKSVNNTRPLGQAGWIGGIVVARGYGASKTIVEPNWHSGLARVVLRGWRCSDGRRLRFWFSNALPFEGRGSVKQLTTVGSKHLTLWIPRLRRLHHAYAVGYLLFSSPGKWVVEARGGEHVLGTALFDFPH